MVSTKVTPQTPSTTFQQQQQEPISFVLRASVHQVTFFSLELVKELLVHARKVAEECGRGNFSLPHSSEGALVLSQILLERRYEEYWPTEHCELQNRRRNVPSALSLLRIGILRALGFQTPGLDEEADDASIVLGRNIVGAALRADGSTLRPLYYREVAQGELQHVALGEWCEDIIFFSLSRGFSAEQVRCVLLTAMHLMNVVAELSVDATDVDVEERCVQILKKLFIDQACGLPNKVFEMRKVERTQTYDVPDPQLIESLEAKMAKAKNKKQQRLLQEQIANVPLISETRVEMREEKVLTEIVVGPYFTLQEVAHILDFFSSSVIQHWRLFRTFLSELQPVQTTYDEQVHWDTWGFCVPPLNEFLRDDVYAMEQERQSIVSACEAAIAVAFDDEFVQPLCDLQRVRDELLEQQKERERQAEEDNIKNALSGPDYMRVARAFALRLDKCIERNEALEKAVAESCLSTHEVLAPATQDPQPPSRKSLVTKRSNGSEMGKNRARSKEQKSADALPLLASQQSPPSVKDTVFSLEEVKARLEKLEVAAQAAVDSRREKKRTIR